MEGLRLTAYTTEQVAGLFQVTPEDIVEWCYQGLFPFFLLPDKSRRHPRPKVDRILNDQRELRPAMTVPRPPLVPIQYAATRFGIPKHTVRRWMKAGLISYIDVPMVGTRLFKEEVDALFAASTVARIVDYDLFFVTRDLQVASVSTNQ